MVGQWGVWKGCYENLLKLKDFLKISQYNIYQDRSIKTNAILS